jgi:hypothetical protein
VQGNPGERALTVGIESDRAHRPSFIERALCLQRQAVPIRISEIDAHMIAVKAFAKQGSRVGQQFLKIEVRSDSET